MTYAPARAQRWFPQRTLLREIAVVGAGALFITLLAQAAAPMAPVPITGQTLGVLLVGGLLGFRRGVAAVGLYLAAGFGGLPVFAAGAFGFGVLLGPTGGYLLGFLAGAGTVGLLAEHGFFKSYAKALLALLVANVAIFALGLAWLASYVDGEVLLALGLWPFLPGAVVKTGLALFALKR